MSHQNDKKRSSLINQEEEDKKLWQNLKVLFSLESEAISDNKIYGTVNIKPKEARKLIKNFALVANDSTRVEFDSNFRKISAVGFDPTRTKSSVHIKAIPRNKNFKSQPSEEQEFSIIRQHLPLTPTISFDWPTSQSSETTLIVRWFHIGDQIAQKYVLCLDGKEILYIREPSKNDGYEICINNLQPGSKHKIEIKARLNNGTETCKSDPIHFTVPGKKNEHNTEVIYVFEEPGDQHDSSTDEDENNQKMQIGPGKIDHQPPKNPPRGQQPTHGEKKKILSCGCPGPHDTFLGVKHYFEITRSEPSPSIHSRTVEPNRKTVSSNKEEPDNHDNYYQNDEDDDDNDVIVEDAFDDT